MGDRSVDARDISRSVVVTGDGNNVALTFGDTGIRLPLRRKQSPPPMRRHRPHTGEPPRELDLLIAEAGRLPLVGRKDLLVELQSWLDDETDISVYGLIGRAGTGKTRLAIEFCQMIDNDPTGKGGWIAGFLSPADLRPVVETLATHSFTWERRTLLVIDYAAQCHQALARCLDRLADQKLDTNLRFLLLDREAPEAFGWWHELTVLGPPTRRDLFRELRPRQLPDLSDLEERRELMTGALQAARKLRTEPSSSPPIPAKGEDADFDRRLAQSQFGNPLNLVMAGVIALDRGPQGALALRRLDAARQIARRELRRLTELARSREIGEDEMRHLVAFNGLAGGLPITDLRKTVADELTISRRRTDRLGEVVPLLQQELPPLSDTAQQPRLATIQPDLVGEASIIEALTGEPSREAEAAEVVSRAYELAPDAAAQALVHLLQDFAYALGDPDATDEEKATGRRVMGWLLNLVRRIEDPEQLIPLAEALPDQTTILREPAAALTEYLAAYFLHKAGSSRDSAAFINAARWLMRFGNDLSALGRREEALQAAEEAARLYRLLDETRPDTFSSNLALSLASLAPKLSALGRYEEAATVAKEAVRLFRPLAEAHPAVFAPYLAMSLANLSPWLSDLGRPQEALTAGEEAVRLYQVAVANHPDEFKPKLTAALGNLSRASERPGSIRGGTEDSTRSS